MKIELDLPDWAKEKNIYIFANEELLAYKWHNDDKVYQKTSRCSGCGQCCESGNPFNPIHWNFIKKIVEQSDFSDSEPCPFLGENGCLLGSKIPFSCVRSDCSHFDECTEEFE